MKATTALSAAAAAMGVAFLLRHPPALMSAGQSGDQIRIDAGDLGRIVASASAAAPSTVRR